MLFAIAMGLGGCGGGGEEANRPPTATSASITTNEDQPFAGVLAASDKDGEALTMQLGTPPARGTVVLTGGLAFTYTPNADVNGTDSFTLTVADPAGLSASATITVTVVPVDDPPRFVTAFALDEDTTTAVDLVSDPEGQALTVTVSTPPAHGTFVATATAGRFSYTPATNFHGTDTIALAADDATGHHATATVTVTVRPVNDPPLAVADTAILLQGKTLQIDPRLNDSDIDGDALTVEIIAVPAGWTAAVRTDGRLDVSPPPTLVGGAPATLEYRVRDPGGLSSSSTIFMSTSFTNGVIYQLLEPGALPELWYADGLRNFRVSAPLRTGEAIQDVRPAAAAPVIFYRTRLNAAVHLFRVDLRNPTLVQEIESPTAFPGVGEFSISEDGTRVFYAFAGRFKFIDFAVSAIPVDRGVAETGPLLNPAGTRAYFRGLMTQQPYTLWGALFGKETLDATPRQQLTTTLLPNDGVGNALAVSRDGRRLFYSKTPVGSDEVLMVMDPTQPGSEQPLLSGTADPVSFQRLTEDETRFFGSCFQAALAGYCLGSTQGGATINLTSGTGSNFIAASAFSSEGSVFVYSRATSPNIGYNARLYRVDTANPNAPVPIADDLPPSTVGYTLGVVSMNTSASGRTLLFSTNEQAPLPSGGYGVANGRLYLMDPVNPASRRTLRESSETLYAFAVAADGTLGIFQQGSSTTPGAVHMVNLLDPSQILLLNHSRPDVVHLVPAYASQGP